MHHFWTVYVVKKNIFFANGVVHEICSGQISVCLDHKEEKVFVFRMVYNVKAETVNAASAWFNYAFLAFLLSNFSLV